MDEGVCDANDEFIIIASGGCVWSRVGLIVKWEVDQCCTGLCVVLRNACRPDGMAETSWCGVQSHGDSSARWFRT